MKDPYTGYIRQVGRELELPRWQRRALLDGLRLELEERFSEKASPEEILTQVGPPAETAHSLLEGVSPEEHERYHIRKRRRLSCIIAALIVLLAVSIGLVVYVDAHAVTRVHTKIVENSVSVENSSDPSGFHASNPMAET